MEHQLHPPRAHAGSREAGPPRTKAEALRCDICKRRIGNTVSYLEETGDVPEPRQSWMLCEQCNAAVHEQMDTSPIRTALRLRIAVGIVSTERTPEARHARVGQLSETAWMKFFFWLFLITMLVHLAVIVAIAGIIK